MRRNLVKKALCFDETNLLFIYSKVYILNHIKLYLIFRISKYLNISEYITDHKHSRVNRFSICKTAV